jgi:hypothetical protein
MVKRAPNPVDKHVGSRVRMCRLMLGDGLGLTFQQVQKYEKRTNRIGPLAAHLAYPANPGTVLLSRLTARRGTVARLYG